MKACSETGCDLPAKTRGMCRKHYHYAWTHKLIPIKPHVAAHGDTEAFIRASLLVETDDCIEWPFAKNLGYGLASIDGETVAAHRATCILAHGPPPFEGAQAAHYKCGNQGCINKRHLRWSTIELNHDDKRRHGTMTQGERHPRSRFTEEEVLAIAASPLGPAALGLQYGCDRAVIGSIKSGRTWSWLTGIRKAA